MIKLLLSYVQLVEQLANLLVSVGIYLEIVFRTPTSNKRIAAYAYALVASNHSRTMHFIESPVLLQGNDKEQRNLRA